MTDADDKERLKMYQCPVLHFKVCDGNDKTELDESITGHRLHCPKCDVHLTSLLLCPECGARYVVTKNEGAASPEEAIRNFNRALASSILNKDDRG